MIGSTAEWRGQRKESVLGRTMEITQFEQQGKQTGKKKEQSLGDLWDWNKRSNICVIRVPGQEEGCGAEKTLEEITGFVHLTLC